MRPSGTSIPGKMLLFVILIFLVAPLSAFADQAVLGIPDIHCQMRVEWAVHDYGPPGTGSLAALPRDGNLEECGVHNTQLDPASQECGILYAASSAFWEAFCDQNRPGEFDGDFEWALGGAVLASYDGDWATFGSYACWGMLGHHAPFSTVFVEDATALPVLFTLTADHTSPWTPVAPGEKDCGDGIVQPCDSPPLVELSEPLNSVVLTVEGLLEGIFGEETCTDGDYRKLCLGRCVVDFLPGIDGTYGVLVGPLLTEADGVRAATQGHIRTDQHTPGPLPAPGGVVITSNGGAPTWMAGPGWDCYEASPWSGGTGSNGKIELMCWPSSEAFNLCKKPLVNAYFGGSHGHVWGGTGCRGAFTGCDTNEDSPTPFPEEVQTCIRQSPEEMYSSWMWCRAEVSQGESAYAWGVGCINGH